MEDLFKTLGDMFKPPITKGSGMQETEKMNDGGLTDDEGNSINFEVGDTIVEYKRPTPNQSKREYGGNGKIVSIVGAMAKVVFQPNNYEQWIALKDMKKG